MYDQPPYSTRARLRRDRGQRHEGDDQARYGEPRRVLEFKDVDRRIVGEDEVLVRVRATSVNTPDLIAVTGVPSSSGSRLGFGGPRPRFAVAMSPAWSPRSAATSPICGEERGVSVDLGQPTGPAIRHVRRSSPVVPQSQLLRKPAGFGFEEAAGVGHGWDHCSSRDPGRWWGCTWHAGARRRRIGRRGNDGGPDRRDRSARR